MAAVRTLRYVTDRSPGIARQGSASGFDSLDRRGAPIADEATLRRIAHLAVPPAWEQVWIAGDPHAHLQATGRDARGRKQYRYHPLWQERRSRVKFERL